MRIRRKHLRSKGWSEQEIKRAEETLKRSDEQKHPALAFLEKAVFWGLLFITLLGIFLMTLVIIPLLLTLTTFEVLFILLILGLCLGALFSLIVNDIEWLERKHHVSALILLGIVALANVWFITARTEGLDLALGGQPHSGLLLGSVFAVALLFPQVLQLWIKNE